MILSASHISKSFGDIDIIKNASFVINEKDKVAIVGLNGAGKTTLLKILTGEEKASSGDVILSKDKSIGYLKQINHSDSTLTILEEIYTVIQDVFDLEEKLLQVQERISKANEEELASLYAEYESLNHRYEAMDGYSAKSRVVGVLKGLGFSEAEFGKYISMLSGGEKTRVFLAKLLIEEPDIILLDEPTNHLDLSSIEWLENYLLNYKGCVIIVSHDRYFLDRIVTRVIDIDNTAVRLYEGNYSEFSIKKASLKEAMEKAYENQQSMIKHQEEVIEKLRSFNREKSIKRAESREKLLNKIERIDKPTEIKSDMGLYFQTDTESGKDVLNVVDISKKFDDKILFSGLHFEVKRGEHIAIMGDNGSGKTTILKIITGLLDSDSGYVQLGSNVLLAYFDQEHQVLDMNKTLFEEIQDTYPNMDNTRVRNTLAAFLFTGDDVYKRISDLSGGERGRISLAKLMLSKANLLILDEPTNHLDIVSKEVLENAIKNFEGTVLYVSHDRYFINQTANRILHLKDNVLYNYIGNYDYFLEKRDDVEKKTSTLEIHTTSESTSDAKSSWLSSKEENARIKKRQNALKKCEDTISDLEEKLARIDTDFLDPKIQTDVAKLIQLQKEKEELSSRLEALYMEWESLSLEE